MTSHKLSLRERWFTFIRFWQIIGVLVTETWAWLFMRQSLPEHLHRAMVRLGPTFIKLGQVASTRPDLIPEDIATRFKEFQENVPPFHRTQAIQIIESELKKPIYEAFTDFPREPVAAASLAQVYFTTLPDGTSVAVKVQRPVIDKLIVSDLAIMRWLARLAQRLSRIARDLRLETTVIEFGRWTLKELDFAVEGHNAEEFRRNFADWEDIIFPKIYWSHTTRRILTMERVSGLRVDEVAGKVSPSFGIKLAKRLAELEMKMFISDAFFHADLHPGNIFFQPDGHIAILDMGMVGSLTFPQRDRFLAYWIAITRRQRQRAFHHLIKMAESTAVGNLEAFRDKYNVILDRFYDKKLSERSLAQTYLEIVVEGARYQVVFPPEMILQAKAIVTAEALDLVLDPQFNFTEEVRPIVAKELAKRATPDHIADRLWGSLAEWLLLGEAVQLSEAVSDTLDDEKQFRRWAKSAIADTLVDDITSRLQALQNDIPKYMSAPYWNGYPEHYSLMQTGLSLLRLINTGFHRLQKESSLDVPHEPVVPLAVSGNGKSTISGIDSPESRWEDFTQLNDEHHQTGGNFIGDELMQVFAYLEKLVNQYSDPTFWDAQYENRASFISLITLLRFLVSQIGQTAHESIWRDVEKD